MNTLKIGTASWTDRSLVDSGLYYPPDCKSAEARLRFYSSDFPLVEVDSTYYGLPSERNSQLWVERTPDDFTFNIKAFRLFTSHQTPPRALPPEVRNELTPELAEKRNVYYRGLPEPLQDRMWEMFESALAPLDDAGKLGVIVFQFPPWFMPRRSSFRHMEECKARLSRHRLAVEFRNQYWLKDDGLETTLSFLRHNRMSYIAVDEPQGFTSSVPPLADVTGEVGLVRFHGRNSETWESGGLPSSAHRFDHYYSDAELAEWVPKIELMRENASEVHLVMNTNNRDQGIVNARRLGEMLGDGLMGGDAGVAPRML